MHMYGHPASLALWEIIFLLRQSKSPGTTAMGGGVEHVT